MGLREIQLLKKVPGISVAEAKVEKTKVVEMKRKPIAKRSKKEKARISEVKKLYPAYLKARPLCVIQSPVCTRKATVVNHTEGRIGAKLLDQSTWEPCCPPCNGFIEDNDAWARERGHKKSRFKPSSKI